MNRTSNAHALFGGLLAGIISLAVPAAAQAGNWVVNNYGSSDDWNHPSVHHPHHHRHDHHHHHHHPQRDYCPRERSWRHVEHRAPYRHSYRAPQRYDRDRSDFDVILRYSFDD